MTRILLVTLIIGVFLAGYNGYNTFAAQDIQDQSEEQTCLSKTESHSTLPTLVQIFIEEGLLEPKSNNHKLYLTDKGKKELILTTDFKVMKRSDLAYAVIRGGMETDADVPSTEVLNVFVLEAPGVDCVLLNPGVMLWNVGATVLVTAM